MRKKIVAGNWKMNKTVAEAQQLVSELIPGLDAIKGIDRLLCPPLSHPTLHEDATFTSKPSFPIVASTRALPLHHLQYFS